MCVWGGDGGFAPMRTFLCRFCGGGGGGEGAEINSSSLNLDALSVDNYPKSKSLTKDIKDYLYVCKARVKS